MGFSTPLDTNLPCVYIFWVLAIVIVNSNLLAVNCDNVDKLVQTEVTRTYYLTRRVAKVSMEVKIKTGIDGEKISNYVYEFGVSDDIYDKIGFVSSGLSSVNPNDYVIHSDSEKKAFKIEVGEVNDKYKTFHIEYHVGNTMIPKPKSIRLGDNQLLEFSDLLRVRGSTSANGLNCKVLSEKLVIQFLPETIIEKYLPSEMKRQNNRLIYAVESDKHKQDQSRDTEELFYVHFSLNTHLVYYDSVIRTISISHWGKINVKEEYSGSNKGALNKGEFHRKEIMLLSGQGFARMRAPGTVLPQNTHVCLFVDHVLPKDAEGLEYFDQIGNISYSNAWRVGNTHTMLQIQPRSPLMGGWNFDYVIEYNLPLDSFVYYDSSMGMYMLNLTMIPSAKGIFSNNITTQIRFPKGAHRLSLEFPKNSNIPSLVKNSNIGSYFGWFDVFKPRPVMEYNMTSSYIPEQFILDYKFSAYYQIESKLITYSGTFLISSLLFIPFMIVVFLNRLSADSQKNKHVKFD
ncbi:putative ribophorin ihypothetical protein [Cryptosporidium ryanae]|uniref:putative ribophorin ihypothetical protein n=1 Tax=Cryptosporidium ryanae TaxID=515981 RepID=UPI003519F73C|nr:putative ribophorin ihypothetical protein [Cryptosporidium ryanae]